MKNYDILNFDRHSFGKLIEGGAGVKGFHTPKILEESLKEAVECNARGMCVSSNYIPLQKKILAGTDVRTVGMFSYPYGDISFEAKKAEIGKVIDLGCDSCDGVINMSFLKSGEHNHLQDELCEIVRFARGIRPDIEIKFIIESYFATDEELVIAAKMIQNSGANFVKTQTGYFTPGPTSRQIALIREAVGPDFGVKGTSCYYCESVQGADEFMKAGADILGVAPMDVLNGFEAYQDKIRRERGL